LNKPLTAAAGALGALALTMFAAPPVRAQVIDVEPEAVDLLRRALDYLGARDRLSATVYNLREDVHESGDRIDFESSGEVILVRPNKLRGVRHAEPVDEAIYYDGSKVTFYNDVENVYMSLPLSGTIEEMFLAVHEYVELYPVSDLLWQNAFPLLMQGVDLATIVGRELIGGVEATHLLFGRPDLGFQIWIPTSGPPLPVKYIVTDFATPEQLSIVTYITDWDTDPDVADDTFTFDPPAGARELPFPKPGTTGE
jgi:hypothetical protein